LKIFKFSNHQIFKLILNENFKQLVKRLYQNRFKLRKNWAFLTDIGLEVEGIEKYESVKGSLEGIVVGKVLTCEQHPNADKFKKLL
jgi:phenylalanyl-tRNA synthetase beta chain